MDKIVNAKDSDDTLTELEFIFYTKQTSNIFLLSTYFLSHTTLDMEDIVRLAHIFIAGHSFIDNLTDIYSGPSMCLLLEIQYLTRSRWHVTP